MWARSGVPEPTLELEGPERRGGLSATNETTASAPESPGVPAVARFETVEPKYSFRADPFAVGDDARADGPVDAIEELR